MNITFQDKTENTNFVIGLVDIPITLKLQDTLELNYYFTFKI